MVETTAMEYEGVAAHARRMGVSTRTVYSWIERGMIPGVIQRGPACTYRIPIPRAVSA